MNTTPVVGRSNPRARALGLLAAALLCGGIAPAHAVPTLLLTPSATNVQASQAFNVKVTATGVTDLYGFQFDVNFNPNLYRVTGVAEGTFLGSAGSTFFSPGTIDNAAGSVSFVFDTIVGAVPGVSGSGLLGTISFTALSGAGGSDRIGLSGVGAVSSTSDTIAFAPVAAVAVSVSAVPEPATWGMMLLGLVGIGSLKRRRLSDARTARANGMSRSS